MIFWPDLARAHYSKEVLTYFDEVSVPKTINPSNIAQGRPIEDFWSVLVQLIYEHNWEVKTTKQLERRIRKKIDITLLWRMLQKTFEKCILKVYFPFVTQCFLKNKRRAFI